MAAVPGTTRQPLMQAPCGAKGYADDRPPPGSCRRDASPCKTAPMLDVINLALPFFGLIFLGLLCGRTQRMPEVGLVWMNFFTIYLALPALFYRILAQTPFDHLNNVPFVVATTLATASAF